MDIFNGNRKLEEAIRYGMDWAIFLRHDLTEPAIPFMYLFDQEKMLVRMLMTDGNPVEYAARVLAQEEQPFQQFVIGVEGYLRNEQNERVDAILIHGYDRTQSKGVVIGQMFEPKEKHGQFKKLGKMIYLGAPDLPIPLMEVTKPDYSIQEVGFSGMSVKNHNGLDRSIGFFSHSNPSAIAQIIRRYIQRKLTDQHHEQFSGEYDINISSEQSQKFLQYLVLTAIQEERHNELAQQWSQKTGRTLSFKCKAGETYFLQEFEPEEVHAETPTPVPSPQTTHTAAPEPASPKRPWWKVW